MRVLQIVPHLPPPFEGVGTYAAALAGALAGRFDVETRFVIGDPLWSGPGNAGRPVAERTAAALAAELRDQSRVILHYVNYGYQRRGCPVWLAEGLVRWRKSVPNPRLITVFHEVWASGPPWRSSFWSLPLQRRLAAALAGMSSAAVTSLQRYGDFIRPLARGREVAVMPVFSTVGEPEATPSLEQRARRLVVFGGAGVRRRAYGGFLPDLTEAARTLAAEEICDVGPAIDLPSSAGDIPIRSMGVLSPHQVGDLLLGSAGGFLAYPPAFLPKSTIFAAYCAHGLLPVCAWNRHPADGLVAAGPLYWKGSGDPQAIASAARAWYEDHQLGLQAETFYRLLTGTTAEA